MALTLTDLARRLRELITALDRRRPRAGDAGEPAIARDAADLREKAVNRLAEIGDPATSATSPTSATDLPPDSGQLRAGDVMNRTAFPATPSDVAALTPQEFTFDLDHLEGKTPRRWIASAGLSLTTQIVRWSGGSGTER